ncbi:uncharacterized protein STEHIDRAFT_160308 [Stereum hirsutum FP-91666 SS1]|uniref:uncharacterized protein n=1 Tax=Stereum hirsutum (strain FP-91666) TaxID=721885 RepID=UPI000444944D|nr:uncharacterized protein STEHIDRAFT_160308 [Stereum hirsutum FP-91666 SS1]EIM82675.1 hypothetical protein STEHIDRAFT_160308 [Stereum hirsutum FP-91666 SS1]
MASLGALGAQSLTINVTKFLNSKPDEPSRFLYAACSTPLKRNLWLPAFDFLNEEDDYIAMYDISSSTVSRLSLLFVYAINHRPPIDDDPAKVGPDSVIEIFTTTVGGDILSHLATVRHPVLETPNDVLPAFPMVRASTLPMHMDVRLDLLAN